MGHPLGDWNIENQVFADNSFIIAPVETFLNVKFKNIWFRKKSLWTLFVCAPEMSYVID